jgi:predicted metalloprotease with PDZ domain
MAGPILSEYRKVFPKGEYVNVRINIVPFPRETHSGTWQAETRGRTVTIVSSDMAFRTQSLQRLHEQLRHELFHLWIPNAVSLTGGYDWFYEGFALYQSLKTGVAVNRISFGDMLSTLSRAYAIDRRQTRRVSMIEASKNRWNAGSTELYARGMLIAFAADVAMMKAKKRTSVADIFRDVYEKHSRPAAPIDGNDAVIAVIGSRAELAAIAERYIRGTEPFDLGPTMVAAGLMLEGDTLKAVERPTSGQKAILDSLGYNNWRRTKKYQNEK